MQPSEPIHKNSKMYTRNWMKTTEIEYIYQKLYTNIRIYKQGLENVTRNLMKTTEIEYIYQRNFIKLSETIKKDCKLYTRNWLQTPETEYKHQKNYIQLLKTVNNWKMYTRNWMIQQKLNTNTRKLYGTIRNCKLELEKVYQKLNETIQTLYNCISVFLNKKIKICF